MEHLTVRIIMNDHIRANFSKTYRTQTLCCRYLYNILIIPIRHYFNFFSNSSSVIILSTVFYFACDEYAFEDSYIFLV